MSDIAEPLPEALAERFRTWKTTAYAAERARYRDLAENGQFPQAIVISCCDSRVQVDALFGAGPGDLFLHRNIANMVPPVSAVDDNAGTAAALEYAIQHLKVSHVIVVGHALCGGVAACYDLCNDDAPSLEDTYIARWISHLRPAYDAVAGVEGDRATRLRAMEQAAVKMDLSNLMEYPFVAEAVANGSLSLHGLWKNFRAGELEYYDRQSDRFLPV